jgi:hypothetical protein
MAGDYKVQTIVAHTEGTYFTFLASKNIYLVTHCFHSEQPQQKIIRRLHIACWHIDNTFLKITGAKNKTRTF